MNIKIDGRFQLQSEIGKGSFGSIYEGIDLTTSKKVAIKMVTERNKLGTYTISKSAIGERRKSNASTMDANM